jgi:hypothetical protein
MSRAAAQLGRPVGPLDSSPTCATPPGLVAWWAANDDASDAFGNNPRTLQNDTGFCAGMVGDAFSFSGTNQAVEIPYCTNLTTPNFSVEAWIQPFDQVDDPISQDLIFGQGYGRFQLLVRPGTAGLMTVALAFAGNPWTFYEVDSNDEIPIGDWTHLVGTWDGTTLSLYINGQLNNFAIPGAVPWDSGCAFHIGGFYDPEGDCAYVGQFFNGAIDEASYYAVALSADDVWALCSAGSVGKCGEQPPCILTQPESQRVPVGADASLSVTAGGMGPFSYQWQFNTETLSGATDSTLTLTGAQLSSSGTYSVVVSSPYGSTTSDIAILTVYVPTCLQPPEGLASWWAGEGSGFDSQCANNGTLQGGAGFTNGMVGQAFNFDGASQYLDVPNNASLNPTAAITVEAWIYPQLLLDPTAAPVIKKAGEEWGQDDGYSLELSGPDRIMFWVYLDSGQGWTPTDSAPLRPNRWSHVAGVYDGASVSFYLNGVLVGTPTAAPGHIVPSGNSLQVGHDPSCPERYFNGLIDEPSIYNTALSAAQIQAIYEAGVAGKCNIPASWLAHYFGPNYQNSPYAGVTADADGDGVSNLQEYLGGTDPNKIAFSTLFDTLRVRGNSAAATITVLKGVPAQVAVLRDSTNFASAAWTPYSPTVPVDLGSTEGRHDVWIGLKGWATDSATTWEGFRLTRDTTPPAVVITDPIPGTISRPVIQLQGFAPEPISGISLDLANDAGILTNLEGYVIRQWFDTNRLEFSTNWFECIDVGPLTNGLNTVTLRVTDLAGNITTTNLCYTLDYASDTNPPVLSLYWPQDGAQVSGSEFNLRGRLDDPTASVTAQIIGAGGATNQTSGLVERNGLLWVEHLPLDAGTNTLSLTMTDAAGNSSVTNLAVVQSGVALAINDLSGANLNQPRISVSGGIGTNNCTVWVNGVPATNVWANGDGTWTWAAEDVPVNPGGTAVIQARAIPNTDNGGSGTGGAGGTAATMENPGNPSSAAASDMESSPEKAAEVVKVHYDIARGDGVVWPLAVEDASSTESQFIRYDLGEPGDAFYWTCWGTPSDQYNKWSSASWNANEIGVVWYQGLVRGSNVCGLFQPEGSGPCIVPRGGSEFCEVMVQRDEGGSPPIHRTRTRFAHTRWELHTHGKALSKREKLYMLTTPWVKGVGNYFWPEVDTQLDQALQYDIDYTKIVLGEVGRLGNDGRVYKVVADNSIKDVTPTVEGNPYYFFEGVGWSQHKLYVLVNGTVPLAEDRVVPLAKYCVGQYIEFSPFWAPVVPGVASTVVQWTFGGTFVNDSWQHSRWVTTPEDPIGHLEYYGSVNYTNNPAMLTNENTHAWWVSGGFDPPDSYTASLQEKLFFANGQTAVVSRTGLFQMSRPKIDSLTPEGNPRVVLNTNSLPSIYLGVGEKEVSGGGDMKWTLYFRVPRAEVFLGNVAYTQLVQGDEAHNELSPFGVVWWISDSTEGAYWLDNTEEYLSQPVINSSTTLQPFLFSDAPSLMARLYSFADEMDLFKTYVRYKPVGEGAIYITLGRIDWGWHGTAEGTPWSLTVSNIFGPVLDASDQAFPQWKETYYNAGSLQ